MQFITRIPNILKRKQKSRIRKRITFYSGYHRYFNVTSLTLYKLYMSRLRMLNLFLVKCVKKFRRISKKDKFRKIIGEYIIRKRFINKQIAYRLGIVALFSESKMKYIRKRSQLKILKYKRRVSRHIRPESSFIKAKKYSRSYVCFDLPKVPFTRKPIGSRMGKGKGAIKAWYIRVYPGCKIISIRNWKSRSSYYILRLILLFLPGKNYVTRPTGSKRNFYLSNLPNVY